MAKRSAEDISVTTFGHLINGKDVPGGELLDVLSPDSRQIVARVAAGTASDVEAAVQAASAAQPGWAAWPPAQREKIFFDVADLLELAKDRFVSWLIDESGSTVTKATFETTYTANLLRAAGGEARRIYGDTLPADKTDRLSIVIREPLGVVQV